MSKKKIYALVSIVVGFVLLFTACTPQQQAQQQAIEDAANRDYYVPHNGVEARNYNWRQEISDDPSLIVWCTFFPTNPNSPMITVPIMGKLTSGGKRPFSGDGDLYPAADGMYGSSGEYRYGFGPSGKFEYYLTFS